MTPLDRASKQLEQLLKDKKKEEKEMGGRQKEIQEQLLVIANAEETINQTLAELGLDGLQYRRILHSIKDQELRIEELKAIH